MPAADLHAIEERLVELAASERTRWQEVSRLLLRVDADSLWQEQAPSFTAWIDGVAARAALQPSGLWRSLKAGRIYLSLVGTDDPDVLGDLQVPAESLELCDKIGRHAPAKVAKAVVRDALAGELGVRELRDTWRQYRPASGGITARGRLPRDPDKRSEALDARDKRWRDEKRKPEVREALVRAELLSAAQQLEWLGPYDQAEVAVEVEHDGQALDAVVVVRRGIDTPLELHAVTFAVDAPSNGVTRTHAMDHQWLAVPASSAAQALDAAPVSVGVLALERGDFDVEREAQRLQVRPKERIAWLSVLLGRSYRWPGV